MLQKPDWKLEAEQKGESLPEYYTLQEAARLLGYNDISFLSKQARENRIPSYKIGAGRFLRPEVVEELLNRKAR